MSLRHGVLGSSSARAWETDDLSWLRRFPIVSLLLALAIVAVPLSIQGDRGEAGARFEAARKQARDFLVRNPRLEVDRLGELILDPGWLAEMRSASAASGSTGGVRLPPRMLARSQARLDRMLDQAYSLRVQSDPAWRFGVLDERSPGRNYFIHAFVGEQRAGVVLSVLVLLIAGTALELAWGSPIFLLFALVVVPATAEAYRFLDASTGIPWSGAAGLAGAILGAYFVRGLGGHFTIPGWILLPAWITAEVFIVRGFWIDDPHGVPWATLCAAVGFGSLLSGGLRLANVESKVGSLAAKQKSRGPHPVVARAARLRSDGDPYQAFDLIQAAWREDPGNEEIAEAFFSIAVEVGQPDAAADAILPILKQTLRKGEVQRAVDYWFPLAAIESDLDLEATAAVRLGEALLDAGHPREALFTLRRALESGVSGAQATRVVKIARDLDAGLARRAAGIALEDVSLGPAIRQELEALVATTSDEPVPDATDPTDGAAGPEQGTERPPESRSQLDRRVMAEHQSIEVTAFPVEMDSDVEPADPGPVDPNEASLMAQSLDAGALSPEALAGGAAEPGDTVTFAAGSSGDVLSHWSGSEATDSDPVPHEIGLLDDDFEEESILGVADLETSADGFDFGLGSGGHDLLGSDPDETDSDLTPMIDETDELTSPIIGTVAGEEGLDGPSGDRTTTAVFDQRTKIFEAPPVSTAASEPALELRQLKALDAVPISMGEDWIEVDAAPRGKSRLPFGRIQTMAMAAVQGLGARPVLVIDFILNGSIGDDEPMKSIRCRSDRFDPRDFESGKADPLSALTAWVRQLQARTNANCLPSRGFLEGDFARFASLEAYEREVLGAVRETD